MNEPLLVESQEYLRCITYQKVNEGLNAKKLDIKVYLSPGPYVDVLYQSMTIVFIFRNNSFSK